MHAYLLAKLQQLLEKDMMMLQKKAGKGEKGVIFKNVAPFTKCISSINNSQIDNAEDIDVVMPMYNLKKYSDNYSEKSGRLWQFYRDKSNDNITESRSSMVKITA